MGSRANKELTTFMKKLEIKRQKGYNITHYNR